MNIEIAIRILKELKNLYEAESTAHKFRGTLSIPVDDEDVDAIETLLTAYEQEKETNKQIKCKLDEKNIPIETLLAEFERLEDLEDDLTTVYLNGVYGGEKKVEDKIKAEIEELQKDIKYSANPLSIDNSKFGIKVLQSLLEKE